MRTLIVYYSRTGTTQRVATTLAQRFNAETVEILCPRYGPGVFRYLRAGYDSVKGHLPPIEVEPVAMEACDLLLLGGPIWTSHPALPLRSFLAEAKKFPRRIALFLTYGGQSDSEVAFDEISAVLPNPPEACIALRAPDVLDGSYISALDAFTSRLLHRPS